MMRVVVVLGLTGALAAESVDPVVAARAKALLAEMAEAETPSPDLASHRKALHDAAFICEEVRAWLAVGDTAAAGERYLAAKALVEKVPVELRPRLGSDFREVDGELVDLARLLLESDLFTGLSEGSEAGPTEIGPGIAGEEGDEE